MYTRQKARKKMEFMKIDDFLANAFSRIINKLIQTKTGFKPELDVDNMMLSYEDNKVNVYLKASMSRESFDKIITEVTK